MPKIHNHIELNEFKKVLLEHSQLNPQLIHSITIGLQARIQYYKNIDIAGFSNYEFGDWEILHFDNIFFFRDFGFYENRASYIYLDEKFVINVESDHLNYFTFNFRGNTNKPNSADIDFIKTNIFKILASYEFFPFNFSDISEIDKWVVNIESV